MKPLTAPIFQPKQSVIYAAFPLIDCELKCFEIIVLTSVSYFQWEAPFMMVKKAYVSIWLCFDFSASLSEFLIYYHFSLKKTYLLNGTTCFVAKLNLPEAHP